MGDNSTKDAALQAMLDTLNATIKSLQATIETNSKAIQRLDVLQPAPTTSSAPSLPQGSTIKTSPHGSEAGFPAVRRQVQPPCLHHSL
jgi:hypothetical protein